MPACLLCLLYGHSPTILCDQDIQPTNSSPNMPAPQDSALTYTVFSAWNALTLLVFTLQVSVHKLPSLKHF